MPDALCGSYAGLQRHKARQERPCEECREAGRKYIKDWRDRTPGARDRDKYYRSTRERALTQLSREYRARYLQILDEIRQAEPLPELGEPVG